jgi:uncharacterized protein (DUF1778 family)
MPRPPRAESPGEKVHIRMTREERERLEQAARASHQNKSDFVRDAIADRADSALNDDDCTTK